jgi:hypothetical protein
MMNEGVSHLSAAIPEDDVEALLGEEFARQMGEENPAATANRGSTIMSGKLSNRKKSTQIKGLGTTVSKKA